MINTIQKKIMKDRVDWNLLAAYIAGELEGLQVLEVEAWIHQDEEHLAMYLKLKYFYELPRKGLKAGGFDQDPSFQQLARNLGPDPEKKPGTTSPKPRRSAKSYCLLKLVQLIGLLSTYLKSIRKSFVI